MTSTCKTGTESTLQLGHVGASAHRANDGTRLCVLGRGFLPPVVAILTDKAIAVKVGVLDFLLPVIFQLVDEFALHDPARPFGTPAGFRRRPYGGNKNIPTLAMGTDLAIEFFQLQVQFGPLPANREAILRGLAQSSAHLCVFPEAATSGFCYGELPEVVEANDRFLEEVREQAARYGRGACLPLLAGGSDGVFNRTFLIGPDGAVLGHYDKVHLIGLLHEDRYLKAGTQPMVLNFPGPNGQVRVGLATCYDLRFPELFRALVLSLKADVLVVPAMWPVERIEHFRILAQARALENLTPIVACNAVGPCGSLASGGRSLVVSEWGRILFEAPADTAGRFKFDFSRQAVADTRSRLPALADARLASW